MDCPQIEIIEQPGFFDWVKSSGKRNPLSGSLEVTFRCNLRCAHCYVGDSRYSSPTSPELTTFEIKNLLDQVSEAGCLWMLLTGGEPLLRPDLPDIYLYSRQLGLLTTLFTNGTLITSRFADLLAKQPPKGVEITLYGATKQTYERVTGIPGSFEKCMRGIQLLVERSVPLKLKTVLLTLNHSELDAMHSLSDSFGLEGFRYDPMIAGRLDRTGHAVSTRLTAEEIIALDFADPKRLAEWAELYAPRRDKPSSQGNRYYQCGAGKDTFHIDPYGQMSVCILSRARTYNLCNGSFQEGWDGFIKQESERLSLNINPCAACDKIALCGKCAGRTELEPNGEKSDDPFYCRLGHLRASAITSTYSVRS